MTRGLVPRAKAGLILTDSARPGSAYAAIMVTGAHGVRMQDNYVHDTAGLSGKVTAASPRWLRLTRIGDTITGYDLADGSHWSLVGTAVLTGLRHTAQAGMFVTSPIYTVTTPGFGGSSALIGPSQAIAAFDDISRRGIWSAKAWTGSNVGNGAASPGTGIGYFGLLEALTMAGLALGALLVPGLMHFGGSVLAMVGVAAVLPIAAAAGGRALTSLDSQAPVPVVQIALLRSLPLFAELPAPALEGLAAALVSVDVLAGAVLIRQGQEGDSYYAIAAGEFDVMQDGQLLRHCGRGEGVGEIALLRAIPRTASVVATTDATVYELASEPFLTAVLGHAATQRRAHGIAEERLADDTELRPSPHGAGAAD